MSIVAIIGRVDRSGLLEAAEGILRSWWSAATGGGAELNRGGEWKEEDLKFAGGEFNSSSSWREKGRSLPNNHEHSIFLQSSVLWQNKELNKQKLTLKFKSADSENVLSRLSASMQHAFSFSH